MPTRQTLGLVGCGAFGEFMLRHLVPYFRVLVHDAKRDDTRKRRIEKFIAMLERGEVPHPNR